MRHLGDVGHEINRPASRVGRELRRRHRIDVPREQHPCATRRMIDPHDQRSIAIGFHADIARGPQHGARDRAKLQSIACDDRAHRHARLCSLGEEVAHRWHALTALEKRRMYHDRADARVPNQIRDRAAAIERRVRDEHRIHAPARSVDPRQQHAPRDPAVRARASVEHHDRVVRAHDMRRAVADREHRRLEAHGVRPRALHAHAPDDSNQRAPPRDPHRTHRRNKRDRDRHEHRATDPQRRRLARHRWSAHADRPLDELDLQPREQPHDAPKRRDQRRPHRADDRLRIRDHKRRRRQRRARKCEQRAERLHRAESHEHHRQTRDECRESGRQRARRHLPSECDPCGSEIAPAFVGHPREPACADVRREVAQRDHATEAELKAWIVCARRVVDDHRNGGERDDRIAVPLAAERATARADGGHERRTHRARRRRHEPQRGNRRERDRRRTPALIAKHEPRDHRHDPPEHREVEPRDREDVREPNCAERILDRAIALFDIAEDERDEHRSDGVRVVVGQA